MQRSVLVEKARFFGLEQQLNAAFNKVDETA
jgi:pilus assembly protein CpaF